MSSTKSRMQLLGRQAVVAEVGTVSVPIRVFGSEHNRPVSTIQAGVQKHFFPGDGQVERGPESDAQDEAAKAAKENSLEEFHVIERVRSTAASKKDRREKAATPPKEKDVRGRVLVAKEYSRQFTNYVPYVERVLGTENDSISNGGSPWKPTPGASPSPTRPSTASRAPPRRTGSPPSYPSPPSSAGAGSTVGGESRPAPGSRAAGGGAGAGGAKLGGRHSAGGEGAAEGESQGAYDFGWVADVTMRMLAPGPPAPGRTTVSASPTPSGSSGGGSLDRSQARAPATADLGAVPGVSFWQGQGRPARSPSEGAVGLPRSAKDKDKSKGKGEDKGKEKDKNRGNNKGNGNSKDKGKNKGAGAAAAGAVGSGRGEGAQRVGVSAGPGPGGVTAGRPSTGGGARAGTRAGSGDVAGRAGAKGLAGRAMPAGAASKGAGRQGGAGGSRGPAISSRAAPRAAPAAGASPPPPPSGTAAPAGGAGAGAAPAVPLTGGAAPLAVWEASPTGEADPRGASPVAGQGLLLGRGVGQGVGQGVDQGLLLGQGVGPGVEARRKLLAHARTSQGGYSGGGGSAGREGLGLEPNAPSVLQGGGQGEAAAAGHGAGEGWGGLQHQPQQRSHGAQATGATPAATAATAPARRAAATSEDFSLSGTAQGAAQGASQGASLGHGGSATAAQRARGGAPEPMAVAPPGVAGVKVARHPQLLISSTPHTSGPSNPPAPRRRLMYEGQWLPSRVSVQDPDGLCRVAAKVSALGLAFPPLCNCGMADTFDASYVWRCARNCPMFRRPDLYERLLNDMLAVHSVLG